MSKFVYRRRIHFYETDLMGVIHHSNYLRFFEEARVAWLQETGLIEEHAPSGERIAAVLETMVRHRRPGYFNDEFQVHLEVKTEKLKFRFQYAIFSPRYEEPLAVGMTLHILVDSSMKVARMPARWQEFLSQHKWTEPWLEERE